MKVVLVKVNEYLLENVWEFDFNEVVGFLDFVINFISIVDEVIKRINEFFFIFYMYFKLYYGIFV